MWMLEILYRSVHGMLRSITGLYSRTIAKMRLLFHMKLWLFWPSNHLPSNIRGGFRVLTCVCLQFYRKCQHRWRKVKRSSNSNKTRGQYRNMSYRESLWRYVCKELYYTSMMYAWSEIFSIALKSHKKSPQNISKNYWPRVYCIALLRIRIKILTSVLKLV